MTAPENPYFARAMVNRVWAQLFGQGLVNPVDNITDENDAIAPRAVRRADRGLRRRRVRPQGPAPRHLQQPGLPAGQRPGARSARPAAVYAAMTIKPMTPEQLYDSLFSVLGAQDDDAGRAPASRPRRGRATRPRTTFVEFFRPGEGTDPTEYATGIPQVLRLMNSPQMNRVGAFVAELVKSGRTPARNVERLYLATLSRRPTPAETERLVAFLQERAPGRPRGVHRSPLGPAELERVRPESLNRRADSPNLNGGPTCRRSLARRTIRCRVSGLCPIGPGATSSSSRRRVPRSRRSPAGSTSWRRGPRRRGRRSRTSRASSCGWKAAPSHKDTFDLKPGTTDAGEFKPIATSVPGIEISEHLPKLARLMHHAAILRGMSTSQGAHGPARYYMHTGYREGSGGLVHPSLGSIVSAELGEPDFPLPNFVSVGGKNGYGAGFLGVRHQPLIVDDPSKGVENLSPLVATPRFEKRFGLLEEMEQGFLRTGRTGVGGDHKTTYQRTVALMQSKEAKAFDLAQRAGRVAGGLWRRRVRRGLPAGPPPGRGGRPVRRGLLGGWDTHQDNFDRVKKLSGQIDPPIAALVADLEARGLLDSTLVIWMGEFGRTPKITTKGGPAGPRPLSPRLEHRPVRRRHPGRPGHRQDRQGRGRGHRAADRRARLPGHGLHDPGHRLHQAEPDPDRPADPHRRQGGQADHRARGLRPVALPGRCRAHRNPTRSDVWQSQSTATMTLDALITA